MTTIKSYYLDLTGEKRYVTAAAMFARDLMKGDPDEMKAGYTQENAILAALEIFDATKIATAALEKELKLVLTK